MYEVLDPHMNDTSKTFTVHVENAARSVPTSAQFRISNQEN